MTKHRLAATAAISAFSLITSQVLAGPKPKGGAPSDAVVPVDPSSVPAKSIVPKFDGKTASTELAKTVARLAGDGEHFLGGGPCIKSGSTAYDHCLEISAGRPRAFATYHVIDTACPEDNTASACYGGYVIATRTDVETHVIDEGTTNTSTVTAKLRFGIERTRPKKNQKALPGKSKYLLATEPSVTVTRTVITKPSSYESNVVVTDSSGATAYSFGERIEASTGGSHVDCEEVGALVEARETVAADLVGAVALVVFTAEAAVISAVGGLLTFVVLTSATVGLGAPEAGAAGVGAGIALFGTLAPVASDLASDLEGALKDQAAQDGMEAKVACETAQKVSEFDPEELEDLADRIGETSSAANAAALSAACGSAGTTIETATDPNGEEYHLTCTEAVVDGECKVTCEKNTEVEVVEE